MFCSKTGHKKIEQIQKRGLGIVYNEPHMLLEELLIYDQGNSVHRKHINTLLTEIYKIFSGENPHFIKSIFNIESKNTKSLNPTQNKCKNAWSLLF